MENKDEKWKRRLYGLYQLHWMMVHGYTIDDIMKGMNSAPEYHDGHIFDNEENDGMHANIEGIYNDWEYDRGFGGSIWACYDEFCYAELLDTEYVDFLIETGMTGEEQHECKVWYAMYNPAKIRKLWDSFGDAAMKENDDGTYVLCSDWFIFPKGTTKESIWHWFDERLPDGLGKFLEHRCRP